MTAVEDVLRRHGIQMDEATFAEHLDTLLTTPASGVDLSAADRVFLQEWAGVDAATDGELAALDSRSASRAAAEVARTLSRDEVARLLGVSASRVSHLLAAGRLWSYRAAQRPVFPDWQFIDPAAATGEGRTLPGLPEVLVALPAGSHPLTVRTFMLTSDDELTLADRELSPRDWLLSDGDPGRVAELARTMGEQV